jgi:hypothetical protein
VNFPVHGFLLKIQTIVAVAGLQHLVDSTSLLKPISFSRWGWWC